MGLRVRMKALVDNWIDTHFGPFVASHLKGLADPLIDALVSEAQKDVTDTPAPPKA